MLFKRIARVLLSTLILSVLIPMLIATSLAPVSATAEDIHSDFNGDGYDDLAIGAPGEQVGTADNAGAVNVIYGSPSGLRTSASGSTPSDQFWHQNSRNVDNSAEAGDGFGSSLATGDFNGDGYDDLAIGVPFEDIGDVTRAGAVHVLYGSLSGLQASSPADQFWHQGKPGVDDSEETNDEFGRSLAAGDFNNDGRDDLAIGVPGDDVLNTPGFGHQGAVNVLYGSPSGLQTLSPADQFWNQDSSGMANDPESEEADTGENFGFSVASGDFNDDGFDDLAIGIPDETLGDQCCGAGAINVIHGSSSGLRTSSPESQFWSQDSPGVEDVAEVDIDYGSDRFGTTLATGDFNGDGFDDLAIGSEFGYPGYGGVNVLYGSSTGLQTSSPADQFWTQDSPGVESTSRNHEKFGLSLASGDFNNDGKDDLAIGAPWDKKGTVVSTGAVHILYGSSLGLQTSSPADQLWNQDSDGVEDNAQGDEQFGYSIAAHDFNNDGKDDLAIGVPAESIDIPESHQGAVNVLYGSSSGVRTFSPADQFWHQNRPGVEDSAEASDRFGQSLG